MRKQWIWLLVLAGLVVTVVVSVSGKLMENKEEKQLLSHMQEKYGESFEIAEPYAGQFGKAYTSYILESKRYPDEKVLARIRENSGNYDIEDNYIAILLKKDLEKVVEELAVNVWGECNVTYQVPVQVFPEYFDTGMEPEAFLKDSASNPKFFIVPVNRKSKRDLEAGLELFLDACKKEGYGMRGCVDALNEMLLFSVQADGEILYMRWLEKRLTSPDAGQYGLGLYGKKGKAGDES